MAGLSPADIATPIRLVLSDFKNTTVLLGEVKSVATDANELHCDFGLVKYDYLILACGASHSYFGNDDWEDYAPGLKTLEQATEIRRRVLLSFEYAEREQDPAKRKDFLTFVVVGGEPNP
jgi:NADH dehydrogenase